MGVGTGQHKNLSTAVKVPPFSKLRKQTWARRHLSFYWMTAPLLMLDILCLALSMGAAYHLRFQLLSYNSSFSQATYLRYAVVSIPVWVLIFALYRLYSPDRLFGGLQEYANVVNATTIGLVLLVLYGFLDRRVQDDISRGWLLMVWVFSAGSIGLVRFGYRRLIYYLRSKGMFIRRALVIGTNEEGQAVVSQLRTTPMSGVKVVGFVEPEPVSNRETNRLEELPVLSGLERLASFIWSLEVDELIVIPTALRRERLLDIYRDWGTDRRVRIHLSSGLYELFTTGVQVQDVGSIPLISLNRTRITGMDALMKSMLDYVGATLGLIALSPLFLVLAFLIRRDSKGPIFHRRRVVGLYGRRFDAFKFRTMIPDADTFMEEHPELKAEWDQTGKLHEDPRITKIGDMLRRYSLDELPQLFNVFRGEMSLVGPRMITPTELVHFGRWRHNLLTVKPGITGLWQVSGRSDLTYGERVALDMRYIRNYTIWLDIKLMMNTVRAVFKSQGAY